jgi:hypothetical protein
MLVVELMNAREHKRKKAIKKILNSIIGSLFNLVLMASAAHAATILFVTAPGATINSASVNAQVTFITSQNQIEIRISNLQQEQGTAAQMISALDWSFGSTVSVLPTQIARSGTLITLDPANGNKQTGYTAVPGGYAGATTDHWNQVSASSQIPGGMEITALSGGNDSQLIIGPPNANDHYQSTNALQRDNPFLQTVVGSYISWTLQFNPSDNITSGTQVALARMSFNTAFSPTSELNLIIVTPEPVGWPMLMLAGVVGLYALGRRRSLTRP